MPRGRPRKNKSEELSKKNNQSEELSKQETKELVSILEKDIHQPELEPKKLYSSEADDLVDMVIKQIKHDHPEGGIVYEESKEDIGNRLAFSTGLPSVDFVLDRMKGIPVRKTLEIFGEESCGKTTLALSIAAEVNRRGGRVVYFDFENSLDLDLAEAIGVKLNTKDFIIFYPENGDQGLIYAEEMIKSNGVNLIIIDSLAALVPKEEAEKGMEGQTMASQARLISKFLRIATALMMSPENKTLLLLISQMRTKMVMFGNPNTTSGGKAPKFYAVARLETRFKEIVKDSKGVPIGVMIKIKAVKNKMGMPYRETELFLRFGEGFDRTIDLIRMAEGLSIIQKKAAWYEYDNQQFHGEDKLKEYIIQNAKYEEIHQKIIALVQP